MEENLKRLRGISDNAAKANAAAGSTRQKIGDFCSTDRLKDYLRFRLAENFSIALPDAFSKEDCDEKRSECTRVRRNRRYNKEQKPVT